MGEPGPLNRRRLLGSGLGLGLLVTLGMAIWGGPDPSPPGVVALTTTTSALALPMVTTTSTTTTQRPVATTTTSVPAPEFQSSITTVSADELHASWRPGCPLEVESLRAVVVTHWGFDGLTHNGRLIVSADIADDMAAIMSGLFDAGFPIERMEPVEVYGGDDDRSMSANNTSAFNCRAVTGGSSWSEHSFGTAIDVNPLVNPYISGETVLPPEAAPYADRTADAPGMIHAGDVVVETFAAYGWVWGGTWSSPKDYQHFSTSGR